MEKIIITGYLGQDARVQQHEGDEFCSFSVATNYRAKDGSEKTTWYNCTLWRPSRVKEFLRRGTQVLVEGRPHARTFTNKAGVVIPTIEINVSHVELLGSRPADQAQPPAPVPAPQVQENNPTDDLPF